MWRWHVGISSSSLILALPLIVTCYLADLIESQMTCHMLDLDDMALNYDELAWGRLLLIKWWYLIGFELAKS